MWLVWDWNFLSLLCIALSVEVEFWLLIYCFITVSWQEQRQSLREQLIEIFGCMCGLEKEMLSQLLCSVLPAELAIEAMNKKEGK